MPMETADTECTFHPSHNAGLRCVDNELLRIDNYAWITDKENHLTKENHGHHDTTI